MRLITEVFGREICTICEFLNKALSQAELEGLDTLRMFENLYIKEL